MLKLSAWWLHREWRYYRSWRWREGGPTIWYFAFGANLDSKVLKDRHMRPLKIEPFVLDDFELRFSHPSNWEGVGYASAHAADGKAVYGHLIQLPAPDAYRMDSHELVPFFRRYQRFEHQQGDRKFYFYISRVPSPGLGPTPAYLGKMLVGLNVHPDIPDTTREFYRQHPTVEPDTPTRDSQYFVQRGRWPAWLVKIAGPYEIFMSWLLIEHVRKWTLFGRFLRER